MSPVPVKLVGELWGVHLAQTGTVIGQIVHVLPSSAPDGPAENSFVFVELRANQPARARYISWINYYDIEHAGRQQSGRWKSIEPPQSIEILAEWIQYGWGGQVLPNVAY